MMQGPTPDILLRPSLVFDRTRGTELNEFRVLGLGEFLQRVLQRDRFGVYMGFWV